MFNQAIGAQYNEGTGISVSGLMTPEYFEKGLQIPYNQTNEDMTRRFQGIVQLDILEN